MSFALLIVSSPKTYAATNWNTDYIFDANEFTFSGVTVTIEEGTNVFTWNGTASAQTNQNLPDMFTANTNGSVLDQTKKYAFYYEYISGSTTASQFAVIEIASTTHTDNRAIKPQSNNYTNSIGFLASYSQISNHHMFSTSGGSFTNLKYKLHIIELENYLADDAPFFTDFTSSTANGVTKTITNGNTLVLNGTLSSVTSNNNLVANVNPLILDSTNPVLITYEYISGTKTSTAQVNVGFKIISLQSSNAVHTGIVISNMSTISISTGTTGSFTDYTIRLHFQEIDIYTETAVLSHTVTFNSNGGSAVVTQTVTDGNLASVPPAPTRAGYDFVEWRVVGTGLPFNFNAAVTSDIELTAVWEANGASVYIVTFDSNGGSAVEPQGVEDQSLAILPTEPTRAGYDFVNWVTNIETEAVYNFTTPVSTDITLYALWIENGATVYTITFIENGGSTVSDTAVEDGSLPVEPTDPTRTGYTFSGWYTDIALTQIYTFDVAPATDMTLYAKWTAVSGGGDPILSDDPTSASVWLYIGIGAAILAVAAGTSVNKKKGNKR